MTGDASRPPTRIVLVATEESGDRLGASLMRQLRAEADGPLVFSGVGGQQMVAEGLDALFSSDEVAIIGLAGIVRNLRKILRRIRAVADHIVAQDPAVVVLIDSPDFNLRVARQVRARAPKIPIAYYVSPTVWAWRSGRARAMRPSVDHLLALLPFEPEVHRRLGGPPCTYVGHPLLERLADLRPDAEELRRRGGQASVLVLPGSRASEIRHHMRPFGETLARLVKDGRAIDVVLPTLPRFVDLIRELSRDWPVQPRIVVGDAARYAAFRSARAALAKSGTVTLELALAGVPMVTAYRTLAIEAWIARRLVRVPSVILANLVLGENAVPEFLQEQCEADVLAPALAGILDDGPARQRQLDAFARIDGIMSTGERTPSQRAADVVRAMLRA